MCSPVGLLLLRGAPAGGSQGRGLYPGLWALLAPTALVQGYEMCAGTF